MKVSSDGTVITIESEKGCPIFQVSSLANFLYEHWHLWGAVLVALGVFFCIYGRVLIDKAIFISVAALTFLIGIFLTFKGFDMWDIHPNNIVFWVIISSWALAGLIVGYCFIAFLHIGLLILAAVAGFILSHLITSAILIQDRRVYWGIIGGTTGAAMVLSCCCKERIKILLTSLIGSFGVVRGISLYLGGFPNEIEL